jgi:DNA-binding IclR family transcriptional regulator
MSIKLSETQLVLLGGAARRDDLHLSLHTGAKLAQVHKAAARLLEAGLVKEVKSRKDAPVWRRDEVAGQDYSLKLTAAGLKAIAAADSNGVAEAAPQAPGSDANTTNAAHKISESTNTVSCVEPSCAATVPVSPRVGTKIAKIIAMLESEDGATVAQLVAATGWLPHTTRAALTGLRKRGYALTSDRSDRTHSSIYRIVTERSSNEATEAAEAAGGAVARNTAPSESGADDQPVHRKRRPRTTTSFAKTRTRKAA